MKIRLSIEPDSTDKLIKKVINKYHFDPGCEAQIKEVYEQLQIAISPYASYRMCTRCFGVKLIDESICTMVAISLGEGVDALLESMQRQKKMDEAYMADCICNELLLLLYAEFNKSYAKFHRKYVKRYVFIGREIPLEKISEILSIINGEKKRESDNSADEESISGMAFEECVRANEYGALSPSKSVVFFAILSDNPETNCEGICLGCGNEQCENRLDSGKQLEGIGAVVAEKKNIKDGIANNLNYGVQRIFG